MAAIHASRFLGLRPVEWRLERWDGGKFSLFIRHDDENALHVVGIQRSELESLEALIRAALIDDDELTQPETVGATMDRPPHDGPSQ